MRVSDVMKREPSVCREDSSVAEAGRVMRQIDCGVLPIVGEQDEVLGVVTDRDLCLALTEKDQRASELLVRDVMTRRPRTCRASQDILEALGIMRQWRVRRLPVVDLRGVIEGIVSLDDIVLEARPFDSRESSGPLFEDIARTLKAICEHPLPARLDSSASAG